MNSYLIIREISRKTGVKETTLKSDWARRRKWMPQIMRLEDPSLIYELLAGISDLLPELWRTIGKHDVASTVRIGAIRTAGKIYIDYITALQTLGYVHQEPTKIEAKTTEPLIVKMWTPEEQEKSLPDKGNRTPV